MSDKQVIELVSCNGFATDEPFEIHAVWKFKWATRNERGLGIIPTKVLEVNGSMMDMDLVKKTIQDFEKKYPQYEEESE